MSPIDTGRGAEFFVVGFPRSGTTLVQRLILELPGVGMPPETHFFSEFVVKLLERHRFPLGKVALEEEVASFASAPYLAGVHLDQNGVVSLLGGRCRSPLELFDAIIVTLAGPSEVFGEKTPDHLRWWRPLFKARPGLRFVVVVREPRSVIASNLAAPFRRDALTRWGDDYHLALAVHWRHNQQLAQHLAADLGPDRCQILRYEDVVARPEETRANLAQFLDRPLVGSRPVRPEGVVLAWETWKVKAFAAVDASKVDAWRGQLSTAQSGAVARLCGPEMEALGYDSSDGRRPTPRLALATRRRLRALRRGLEDEQSRIDRISVGPS